MGRIVRKREEKGPVQVRPFGGGKRGGGDGEDRREVKEALFLKGERVEERAFWTPLWRRLRRWEARDRSWRAVVEDARRRRCCASRTITS